MRVVVRFGISRQPVQFVSDPGPSQFEIDNDRLDNTSDHYILQVEIVVSEIGKLFTDPKHDSHDRIDNLHEDRIAHRFYRIE
jgi:hypothetical protein